MNIFKHSFLTFCLLFSGMSYSTPDVVSLEQSLSDTHNDLDLSVRSPEEVVHTILEQTYPDAQVSMLDVCRIALTGCAELYLTLYEGEKDDLIKMISELLTLRSMVENYCDGCLKDDPIIKKYKSFMHLENMSLHGSIGCASCNDTKHEDVAEVPFSMKTFLKNPAIQEFYATLDTQEKKHYKEIVKGMDNFCKDIVKTVEVIIDHYPSLKEKIKAELENQGVTLLLTVQFDEPFPSATYHVI